jgi:hypothetical protein
MPGERLPLATYFDAPGHFSMIPARMDPNRNPCAQENGPENRAKARFSGPL